jgi:hypothetical protein
MENQGTALRLHFMIGVVIVYSMLVYRCQLEEDSTFAPPTHIRKITPQENCSGNFSFSCITLTYPTLPHRRLPLPTHELTFIVGSKSSAWLRKSTITQLFLHIYQAKNGAIPLNDTGPFGSMQSWAGCDIGQQGHSGGLSYVEC